MLKQHFNAINPHLMDLTHDLKSLCVMLPVLDTVSLMESDVGPSSIVYRSLKLKNKKNQEVACYLRIPPSNPFCHQNQFRHCMIFQDCY